MDFTPESGTITMFSTTWCGYCNRLKKQLDAQGIGYTEINIEEVEGTAELVEQLNGGNQTVPTVLFPDGTAATNPSAAEVKEPARRLGRFPTCQDTHPEGPADGAASRNGPPPVGPLCVKVPVSRCEPVRVQSQRSYRSHHGPQSQGRSCPFQKGAPVTLETILVPDPGPARPWWTSSPAASATPTCTTSWVASATTSPSCSATRPPAWSSAVGPDVTEVVPGTASS